MPLKIKDLGYTLGPGERFIDETDCVDDEEPPKLESYTKSEINLKDEYLNDNTSEILTKIKEIELKPVKGDKKVPWLETLAIVGDSPCDESLNREQSLKLEEHFKDLASSFVKTGLRKLLELKVDFNRPTDFYAEMMKSDEHMSKIMKNLERKQKELLERKATKNNKKKKGVSRRTVELQEKNKFIKKLNLIKKKHKNEDIDKQVEQLISTSSSKSSQTGKPKLSKPYKTSKKGTSSTSLNSTQSATTKPVSKSKSVKKVTFKGLPKDKSTRFEKGSKTPSDDSLSRRTGQKSLKTFKRGKPGKDSQKTLKKTKKSNKFKGVKKGGKKASRSKKKFKRR